MLALIALCGTLARLSAEPPARAWWHEAENQPARLPCLVIEEAGVAFDGELDEWAGQPALPLGLARQTGYDREWSGPNDLSATFRFNAGADALLFAAEVRDDRLVTADRGDRFRGDQIQLFLGTEAETRGLILLPGRREGTLLEPAEVFDADRREPVPGAVLTWHGIEQGYRVELRLPWSSLPGGLATAGDQRRVQVAVVDWDGGDEKSRLNWPTPFLETPAAPGPGGWQPPAVERWRPASFGTLELVESLTATELAGYLPTFMPLGVERNFYTENEEVRVIALAGMGPEAAARLELYALTRDGLVGHLSRGVSFSEGAVAGVAWSWRTPAEFDQPVLLVGVLDELTEAAPRSFARLESIGAAFRLHLERLRGLRERIYQAAVAPGSTTRMRRYYGSILINMEDKEQSHSAWLNYLIRDDVGRLVADLNEFERLYAEAQAGRDPYGGRKGAYLRGYVSELDDTVQHYSVNLPDRWSPDGTWPLIVSIHGYGFGRFLGHPAPGHGDAVGVACFGRGNGDYKLWCEDDILTVIDAMLEDYRVDPNRVYITGGSMGGTGSYHMASLYPDRFAAIAPTCGNANHHVWEEVWGWGQREPTFLTPFRNWLESTTSAYQYAENFRHVPAYIVHGDQDDIVPVGHGRTMSERLRKLGYELVYEEQAGVGHSGFSAGTGDRQKRYFMQRVRDPYPRQVTYKSSWPRNEGAYWVYLERRRRLAEDAQIDVTVNGQQIRVQTSNLARFRLELNDRLLDLGEPVTVTVDGLPAYEGLVPATGILRLGVRGIHWRPVDPPAGLEKNARIGGPIEHAFMSRFLLVCGTSGDRRTNEVNRRMCEQAAEKWRRWGREQRARVKMDWEVTEQDIADSNLICYGGPDSNRLVARVNRHLPVRLEPGAVVFGDERFEGRDVGLKVCYPNPLNPTRYVCIFAGVTWEGTYDINGRFGNWFDWGVFDDRNWFDFAVFDSHTQSPETFLRVGYFDQDWRLDEAYLIEGSEAERAKVKPRRPPDPLAPIPAGEEVHLSDLTPAGVVMEKGVLAFDHSFGGYPIRLGNMTFERGLGVHPQAELTYDLNAEFRTFETWCGVDLEGARSVSTAREEAERVAFQVYGDDKLLADTGEMRWNSLPRHLVLDITGVRQLRLMARALDGRKWLYGNSSWGLARLSRQPEALPRRHAAGRAELLRLDGDWFAEEYDVGQGVAVGAQLDGPGLVAARPVRIPGSIPAAEEAAGRLPALYQNDHLARVDALAGREWWLYRRFDLPASWADRHLRLRLAGVCQIGEAWLNGEFIGAVRGPFEEGELDATAAARCGAENLLAVRILAGPAAWTGVQGFRVPDREEVLGYGLGYGSDGGPRAIPLGILGGAEVRATGPVTLGQPGAAAVPTGGLAAPNSSTETPARITVSAAVTNRGAMPVTARLEGLVRPFDRNLETARLSGEAVLQPGETRHVELAGDAAAMQLWWPAELGAQALYQVELSLTVDGAPSDSRVAVVAARRLELLADGGLGVVRANGYAVPLRIAEWLPTDRLLRWDAARAEQILVMAREAGINTIRVHAAGGWPGDEFYALCDRLGLLVLQDLPLVGNIGRARLEEVAAAARGIVLGARAHPCLLGYIAGEEVALDPASEQRLAAALAVVAELDPARPLFDPVPSADGAAEWRFVVAGEVEQQVRTILVERIVLPGAPPAELSFLDRAALGENEAQAPWPLTGWWRFRGGGEADLEAAEGWLGPLAGESAMLAGLSYRQADEARRRLGQAIAAGRTVVLAGLNESWPRIGGALVDHAGTPRPAYGAAQRLLGRPALFAVGEQHSGRPGDLLRFRVHAHLRDGVRWWEARPAAWREVRCRVLGLDGRTYSERLYPLADDPPDGELGEFLWEIEPTTAPGAYLLVTDLPGSEVPSDLVPLTVTSAPALAPVRVVWLAAAPATGPAVERLPRERLEDPLGTFEAIWLGDGFAAPTEREAALIAAHLQAGAGLVIDGPPRWLAGTVLEALLPATPTLSPEGALGPAVAPATVAAGHPVAAALAGLPVGRPEALYTIAGGAQVISQFGAERPLLVESALGRGRILLWQPPRAYARLLRHWPGRSRLQAALLAYVAKLPHHAAQELTEPAPGRDLSPLMTLPEAPVRIDLDTSPLACDVDSPGSRDITLRNDGGTPILALQLRMTGLPEAVSATFSRNGLVLMPGESRRVTLTVRSHRRGRREARAALLVEGWGVRPGRVEFSVVNGG